MLRACKVTYRRKLEAKLQQNNVRDVWTGMKQITGCKVSDRQSSGSLERAKELNIFFNTSTLPCMTVTTGQVRRQLERLHQQKVAGPDDISPRILKTCARQLSPVLQHLYKRIPMLCKTSCLVPVPKKSTPSGLNDYRPVALTSYVMKVLERLVLANMRPQNSLGQLVEDGSPICRSCKKKVAARGGDTSNLRDHHPQLFSECKRQSAGQSNAAATTSHSTSVTQTLKGHVSKTGCLIPKSGVASH
ncbi:uncharacterized protein LOC119008053 [Acanthopagrus latus]|uniref:uncharacterized protein LOC119008053 n=1 Tax=Acanthopagrus latus TaxID=8177 RepID=UPI00187C3583|nr:uncharacterized protein LOC119008053 [Acanthopagrus latus]